jgi:hypothetical protein
MALNFPNTPVDGQVYDNFIYDASKGTWKSLSSGASPSILEDPTITNATITDAVITATADNDSTIPLTVNGAASQSANLQEWKNSAGIVLSDIDQQGKANFETGANAANIKASSTVNHGYLAFYTENTTPTTRTGYFGFGSNGTTTMAIANERSSGTISLNASYVKMPNQPRFDARRSIGSVPPATTIIFDIVNYNVGSAYNASNGRFTAPSAGYYRFVFSSIMGSTAGIYRVYFRKNNVNIGNHAQIRSQSADAVFVQNNREIIIDLEQGDYITCYYDSGPSDLYGIASYTTFHGELVG